MGGASPLSRTTTPSISSPSPCQPPHQHFRWFYKNLTNPTHHRRGCRGFCRGQRGAVLETYCRKLAARFQLLVPTGGKVYKSLIRKKKKKSPPILFLLSPPFQRIAKRRGQPGLGFAAFLSSYRVWAPCHQQQRLWGCGKREEKK